MLAAAIMVEAGRQIRVRGSVAREIDAYGARARVRRPLATVGLTLVTLGAEPLRVPEADLATGETIG